MKKAHTYAIVAIILWVFCITFLIAFIFQILLVVTLFKLDQKDCPDRTLMLILAIIGIFYAGWILNIIIAAKLRSNTRRYTENRNPQYIQKL